MLAAALGSAGRAEASLVQFDFSYSGSNIGGGPVSGSGYLFGNYVGGGTYLLTLGYGTSLEAGNLTLEPAGTYINTYPPTDNLISDNLLTPASNPVLDGDGIVFAGSSLPPTSQYCNIWGNGPGNYTYFNNYDSWPIGNGTLDSFTVTGPVPEPATLTLLGTAIVTFCGIRRRQSHAVK